MLTVDNKQEIHCFSFSFFHEKAEAAYSKHEEFLSLEQRRGFSLPVRETVTVFLIHCDCLNKTAYYLFKAGFRRYMHIHNAGCLPFRREHRISLRTLCPSLMLVFPCHVGRGAVKMGSHGLPGIASPQRAQAPGAAGG